MAITGLPCAVSLLVLLAITSCGPGPSVEDFRKTARDSYDLLPDSEKRALAEHLCEAAQRADDETLRKTLARGIPPDSHPPGWWNPLMEAVGRGHPSTAELLLDRGADLNARLESNGMTVLMIAALNKKPRMVKLLLDRGADVRLRDYGGNGVRYWAEVSSNKESISLVKKAGAEL